MLINFQAFNVRGLPDPRKYFNTKILHTKIFDTKIFPITVVHRGRCFISEGLCPNYGKNFSEKTSFQVTAGPVKKTETRQG